MMFALSYSSGRSGHNGDGQRQDAPLTPGSKRHAHQAPRSQYASSVQRSAGRGSVGGTLERRGKGGGGWPEGACGRPGL